MGKQRGPRGHHFWGPSNLIKKYKLNSYPDSPPAIFFLILVSAPGDAVEVASGWVANSHKIKGSI